MTEPIFLPSDREIYSRGFTNAYYSQRALLYLADQKDPIQWKGQGENANPMAGPESFKTPADKSNYIKAALNLQNDHGTHEKKWVDSYMSHYQVMRLANFSQLTFLAEDGVDSDSNDCCMIYRWWNGPPGPKPQAKFEFPHNRKMFVHAFTNNVNYAQKISIDVPGVDTLIYTGVGEGLDPMDGPKTFTMGNEEPTVSFSFSKDGKDIESFVTAKQIYQVGRFHQFTWLARNEKSSEHQDVVLCIYHWD